MKHFITLFLILGATLSKAQDTIRVLHYNLLDYGNYTTYCTTGNNNHEVKDGYIRTLIAYEKPDIFTCNEVSNFEFYQNRILTTDLNVDGRTWYKRATITNTAGSDIVNMLYYNSGKLVLKSHEVLQSAVRDIDLFTLYCITPHLSAGDTVWLNCVVAHLKAGNTETNAATRATMTANAIAWLKLHKQPGNYLIMGDFNTYTSSENCYQNLISSTAGFFRFYDPVNKPGDWNNNGTFARWHTQSVASTSNGCQASGGMDDRFDHIMASYSLMNGTNGLHCIPETYHAVGQDGNHFNKSINDYPINTSVPADVLEAIASNSDHLPVRVNLLLPSGVPGGVHSVNARLQAVIVNSEQGFSIVQVSTPVPVKITATIYNLAGQLCAVSEVNVPSGISEFALPDSGLGSGLYLVRLQSSNGGFAGLRLIK